MIKALALGALFFWVFYNYSGPTNLEDGFSGSNSARFGNPFIFENVAVSDFNINHELDVAGFYLIKQVLGSMRRKSKCSLCARSKRRGLLFDLDGKFGRNHLPGFVAKSVFKLDSYVVGEGLPIVFERQNNDYASSIFFAAPGPKLLRPNIGANLFLSHFAGYIDSILRGFSGFSGLIQSQIDQSNSYAGNQHTSAREDGGQQRPLSHFLLRLQIILSGALFAFCVWRLPDAFKAHRVNREHAAAVNFVVTLFAIALSGYVTLLGVFAAVVMGY